MTCKQSSLREITEFVGRGKSPEYEMESEHPVLNQACIQWGKLDLDNVKFISESHFRSLTTIQKTQRGDILVNSTGTGTLGRIGYWDRDANTAFDGHVTLVRLKPEYEPRFFYYWLHMPEAQLQIQNDCISGSTNQIELSREAFRQVRVRYPEARCEQAKIAELLATVDRAIEQTEALIAKYRRIKISLMQDLLTRGIDEYGQLRDLATHRFRLSTLGAVPEEWRLTNLGEISTRITSGSRGWARYYSEEGAKFIRIGNLTREHINLALDNVQAVRLPSDTEGKRTSLEAGDLLISITADLGIIGVVPEDLGEAYINQHIALLKLDKTRVNPWWIGNYLAGHRSQQCIAALNESGAKAGLSLPTVASIPVPLPSAREQNEVARILHSIDDLLAAEKARLAKAQRLKAGLMQDLLTGKVSIAPLLAADEEGVEAP
jgi:type I restriction enzyme S subunit